VHLTRVNWDSDCVSEPRLVKFPTGCWSDMSLDGLCIQPVKPAVGVVFSCRVLLFTMSLGPIAAWGPPDKVSWSQWDKSFGGVMNWSGRR
jgi:hypothetical protein